MKHIAPMLFILCAYAFVGTLDYQDALVTEQHVRVAQR